MTFTRVWLLACLSAVVVFGSFYAAADIGPITVFKGGGGVAPKSQHERIRLDSQEVMIRLKPYSYTVNVLFNLFNEGETVTEWIGFPKWVTSQFDYYPTFTTFKGSINGREIEFNEEADSGRRRRFLWTMSSRDWAKWADRPMKRQRQWLASRVTFPGHAKARIRVTYDAKYYGRHARHVSYVYGTGSLWKGNIGKAVFIVDSTWVGGTQKISTHFRNGSGTSPILETVKPVARPVGKNILCFDIRDFEPDPASHLSIRIKGWLGRKANYVRPKTTMNPVSSSGDPPPAHSFGPREGPAKK